MAEMIGILIVVGIIAFMLFIVFIKANLIICKPNEVMIISGRRHKLPDGNEIGYRILKGGRGFKIPIIETVNRLPLTAIPIEITISKALCKGIIPINIDGRANIKIAGTEKDGLNNAIERFLGKNLNEVALIAKQAIEGSLRGVLATVSPEEANSERTKLAERVVAETRNDLQNLGIVLDYFKIQNISDEQGYLEAIGRKKNADIIKNAKIAEATAESEARKINAEQKRIASVAEAEAEEVVIKANNKLAVRKADLNAETNRAEEKAKLAGDITRVEEEQLLEQGRILLNRKRYEADVVIPAEAEKTAAELKSVGEASTILEKGKATAEAIERMRAQWQEGNSKDLFIIQLLPELLDKVTRVVADNLHIDKLTVLDNGNGNGVPTHVKNLTGSAIMMLEQLKNATGLDLTELLQNTLDSDGNGSSHIQKELT
jgi:flotillin